MYNKFLALLPLGLLSLYAALPPNEPADIAADEEEMIAEEVDDEDEEDVEIAEEADEEPAAEAHAAPAPAAAVIPVLPRRPSRSSGGEIRLERRGSEAYVLHFPEPVVGIEAVNNAHRSDLSAADRGTDIFTVTGDDAHRPELRWMDQDTLSITAAEGTRAGTPFQLSITPGQQYLGGATIDKREFDFSFHGPHLRYIGSPDLPGVAVALMPNNLDGRVKPHAEFGPACGITYTFTQLREKKDKYGHISYEPTDKKVAGRAEPLRVRHGVRLHALLSDKDDVTALTADSPLRNSVLVVPSEELPAGTVWQLSYTAADGYADAPITAQQTVRTELETRFALRSRRGEQDADAAPQQVLQIGFSAPVAKADVERLFREMQLKAGAANLAPAAECPATAGEAAEVNGKLCRTLELNGKTVTFTYVEKEDGGAATPLNLFYRPARAGKPGGRVLYRDRSITDSLCIAVESDSPLTAEAVLADGSLKGALGLPLKGEHRYRITLTPAAPVADLQQPASTLVLPRSGAGTVGLLTAGGSKAEITATYFSPQEAMDNMELLEKHDDEYGVLNGRTDKMEYLRAWLQCRALHKLKIPSLKEFMEEYAEFGAMRMAYSRYLATLQKLGTTHPSKSFDLPAAKGGTLLNVNLKELTGSETLRPGAYLLSLRITPSAAAAEAIRALGQEPLPYTCSIMVRVEGLKVVRGGGMVFVNRYADGSLPETGMVYLLKTGHPLMLKQGVAVTEDSPNGDRASATVVMSGDDWGVLTDRYYGSPLRDPSSETVAEVLTDRMLYRPGETVHLYGMVRRAKGNASERDTATEQAGLRMVVRGPDRKELATQKVTWQGNGCFEASFTLPNGEEDVTGSYTFQIHRAKGNGSLVETHVESRVFRRDSFTLKTETVLDKVDPKSFRYAITATDLNGTPLANTKVKLNVSGSSTLSFKEGKTNFELTTDAAGKAELTLTPEWRAYTDDENGNNSVSASVSTQATVANDREEVRRCSTHDTTYRTDFRAECDDLHLRLYDTAAGKDTPLPREQVLQGKLTTNGEEREELPNGFIIVKPTVKTLWEGELRFPANDTVGVDIPCPAEEREHFFSARLELKGTDAAGREFRSSEHVYVHPARRQNEYRFSVTASETQDALKVDSREAGRAYVLVQSGKTLAAVLPLELKEGRHTYALDTALLAKGDNNLVVAFPRPNKDGFFDRLLQDSCTVRVEDPARTLNVTLNLPEQAVRPSAEVRVSGCITTHEGKAADAAVLLYAVDEGMLMVRRPLPDWQQCFSTQGGHFSLPWEPSPLLTNTQNLRKFPSFTPLPGLWVGERKLGQKWVMQEDVDTILYRLAAGADGDDDDDEFGGCDMAPAPCVAEAADCVEAAPRARMEASNAVAGAAVMKAAAPVAPCMAAEDAEAESLGEAPAAGDAAAAPAPRMRTNFTPVAVWAAALRTDAEGRFETTFTVPDTLTTYKVFCVAADAGGNAFANQEAALQVNQPVMLTPGTPFFMSTGDRLLLPLTVTNATESEGTWKVTLKGMAEQQITLAAKATGTLYFEVAPQNEGEEVLEWTAVSTNGADAVEGRFPVRYPAPLLKEAHHVVLAQGITAEGTYDTLKPASLLAEALATSERGELTAELSANPLLHLSGCVDFLVTYPYGCTEQISTGLLPWLMYDRIAPFCPAMAETPANKVAEMVNTAVEKLFKRQQKDGGLSYWNGGRESCFWASAHAALVLQMVQEKGYALPSDKFKALRDYIAKQKQELEKKGDFEKVGPLLKYEVARVLEDAAGMRAALAEALGREEQRDADGVRPLNRAFYCWVSPSVRADLLLLEALQGEEAGRHPAFLTWLRSRARDYRHPSTWTGAWTLLALYEYLAQLPPSDVPSSITLADGRELELNQGVTKLTLATRGSRLGDTAEVFTAAKGQTYVTLRAKAQPQQTEYPGVTEAGLQITRRYEKKGEDGVWRTATEFRVGDVVRVSLTCAKVAEELDYLVLEDYLPSCMEAIDPAIPTQAAGIEFVPWSFEFDNKEYLADRVRGFCTRWGGRNLLNMVYFARVKRAGISTAPPAQAQLMYEPQVHGLSPNVKIQSQPK